MPIKNTNSWFTLGSYYPNFLAITSIIHRVLALFLVSCVLTVLICIKFPFFYFYNDTLLAFLKSLSLLLASIHLLYSLGLNFILLAIVFIHLPVVFLVILLNLFAIAMPFFVVKGDINLNYFFER